MKNNLFTDTLTKGTSRLVSLLQEKKPEFLKNFYLSGGTGLSLQIGHRESEDLDFFSKNDFDPDKIKQDLEIFSNPNQVQTEKGTLNCYIEGTKLQFLHYPYNLLEPTIDWSDVKISSTLDIACTKLITIGARGSKKDFVDIYFLLKKYSLAELFESLEKKYTGTKYDTAHIMKSLIYFKDAENQPMPRMHSQVDWEDIKSKIIEIVGDQSSILKENKYT